MGPTPLPHTEDTRATQLLLPVSDRPLRLKLLASGDQRHRLYFFKAKAAMNAVGLRRCVEEKEAMAAAYADLSDKSIKECRLYERDLERAIESCDDLVREGRTTTSAHA